MQLKGKKLQFSCDTQSCRGRRLLEGLLPGESCKRQSFTGGNNHCLSDDMENITVLFLNFHASVFLKPIVLLGVFLFALLRGKLK